MQLAFGVGVFTFLVFRNTGDATETFSTEPADIFKPEKGVGVDLAGKRIAGEFSKTAVARKNLAASYDLVAPDRARLGGAAVRRVGCRQRPSGAGLRDRRPGSARRVVCLVFVVPFAFLVRERRAERRMRRYLDPRASS